MDLNRVVFKFVSISFSILVALLVIMGLVKLGNYCYDFGYRVFTEAPMEEEPGRDVILQVTSDMSDMDIGELLVEKGLIRDKLLFFVQLKLASYSGKLNPGVYTLNTSMDAKTMMAVLAAVPEEETETEETSGITAEEDPETETEETEAGTGAEQ
jgi:UPF0755 protein